MREPYETNEDDPEPNYVRELSVVYSGPRRRFDRLCSSKDVESLARRLKLHEHLTERFVVVLLDAKLRPTGWSTISIGSIAACPVEPSDVFRVAIRSGAEGMVLMHNHPSGDPAPSPEDIALTDRLLRAGDLLGVTIYDHVIVAEDGHFSFLDAGMLPHE